MTVVFGQIEQRNVVILFHNSKNKCQEIDYNANVTIINSHIIACQFLK